MKRFCIAALLSLVACSPQTPSPPPAAETQATETQATETQATATQPSATTAPPQPACVSDATRLCPVDDGAADADFAAFRAELLDIVKRRDETALLARVDPKMRVSFGDAGGVDAFRKMWKLPSAESPLWPELEFILSHGGSFLTLEGQRMFRAPYFYANWPDAVDAFEHVAAVRADVPLYAKADTNAEPVAESNYGILQVVPDRAWRPGAPWRQVRTHDGKTGWVQAKDVRSSIDYRALFSKRSGAWKLETLVAGD